MDLFEGLAGLQVVMKGVGAEHRVEEIVFEWQLFGAGNLELYVLQAVGLTGDFDHPRRYVDSAEHSVVLGQSRNLADSLARSTAQVQEADSSLDVEEGKRLSLHPAKIVETLLVVGISPRVPFAGVSLFVFRFVARSQTLMHSQSVTSGSQKSKSRDENHVS